MASGLAFRCEGEISEKMSFVDKEDGKTRWMVRVNWMGGSRVFMCEQEQYGQLPETGPIVVSGPLSFDKDGKGKLKADRFALPKPEGAENRRAG